MAYLQIISAFLFLVSIGSMSIHRAKNEDAMIESSISGKLFLTVLPLISFALLALIINNIGKLKWYYSLIIAVLCVVVLSRIFAKIYSPFLGYKSKPYPNLRTGTYDRRNLYIIDTLITFGLGLILLLIGNI